MRGTRWIGVSDEKMRERGDVDGDSNEQPGNGAVGAGVAVGVEGGLGVARREQQRGGGVVLKGVTKMLAACLLLG